MKFEVDNYEIIKNDKSFMILAIDVLSNEINKHGTTFSEEDIVRHIPKISNKPLNCIIEGRDFKGHATNSFEERRQIAVGTVPESNRAEIVEKKGYKFLRVYAIIWKYLFPNAEGILKRRKEVAISMEIDPLKAHKREDGYFQITEWDFEAITLLGARMTPAVSDAKATIIKYGIEPEKYFDSVLIKYGIFVDEFIVPETVSKSIEKALGQKYSNVTLIEEAQELVNKHKLTYSEVKEISKKIEGISGDEAQLLGGESFKEWAYSIVKEKEGERRLDKLKELLQNKFSSDLRYAYHDENAVYCFDLNTGEYKKMNYAYQEKVEDGEEEKFEVKEEEAETVYKVKGEDTYVDAEKKEEYEMEDEVKYSLNKLHAIKEEKESLSASLAEKEAEILTYTATIAELETKFAEIETEKTALATEKEDLETKFAEAADKIIQFASLEEELTSLREYKTSKETAEKQSEINKLYAKYAEYLTEDEINGLNEIAKDLDDMKKFTKELYAITTPKVEAKLEALRGVNTKSISGDNLKYSNIPLAGENQTPEGAKKATTLLEKLSNL